MGMDAALKSARDSRVAWLEGGVATRNLRVVGVSIDDVSGWNEPLPAGKRSQFFGELARRVDLLDVVRPELSAAQIGLIYARTFHPRKSRWRARASFSGALAARRTAAVQRGLAPYAGSCDLIIQLQTLCAPAFASRGVPYAIYTDNTMALTQRAYPAWAPLSPAAAASWMRFEAGVFRRAHAVFTYSEFARRSVIEDYGCPPERVAVVRTGANQMLDSADAKDYSAPRALFVGIEFERKGGPVLLEAWRIVRERIRNAELLIAGPRGRPRGALPAGVTWTGPVDRAGLDQLYRRSSLFVMPSLYEPWGHVFFEAMGYGLPCIGTSCCAMPEIIDDGVTGRLVPRGEPEPLAQALIELLSDPERRSEMGHVAHAEVLAENRWCDVLDRVMAHLDSDLGPRANLPAG
jgi:glycosyltransferase involved in cell wall biosynthesis